MGMFPFVYQHETETTPLRRNFHIILILQVKADARIANYSKAVRRARQVVV